MTLEIPAEFERAFGDTPDEVRRRALECLVVEAYKKAKISRGQVRELLGLNWYETEDFLAREGATYHYTVADLDDDIATGRRLLKIGEPGRR